MSDLPILFMTGTVAPPQDSAHLKIADPQQRIGEYRRALRWNLDLLRQGHFGRLVFVENSGFGMAEFESDVRDSGLADTVEMLSYDGNAAAGTVSRLALEASLLKHGFDTLDCLQDRRGRRVWKVTGRYVVKNIAAIARHTPDRIDLAVHCRDRPVRFVETAVLGLTTTCGRNVLARILDSAQVRRLGESGLRALLDADAFADLQVARRLARVPDYSGCRGTDGASFDDLSYRLKHNVRAIAHRVLPNAWI